MFSRDFSIQIDAPVEQVFRYVTDLKRHPEWASNKMEMTVEGEPVAVGTTFTTAVSAFGKETNRGKVLEMQSPSKFVYECDTSSSGLWRWTMLLEPAATGTVLTHRSEALKLPGWFKVMLPVVFPLMGKKMTLTGLKNIKARVEAGGGA